MYSNPGSGKVKNEAVEISLVNWVFSITNLQIVISNVEGRNTSTQYKELKMKALADVYWNDSDCKEICDIVSRVDADNDSTIADYLSTCPDQLRARYASRLESAGYSWDVEWFLRIIMY